MKNTFNFLFIFLFSMQFFGCTDYSEIELETILERKKVNYFLIGSKKQPYFFSLNSTNVNDELPKWFVGEDGYKLGVADSLYTFDILLKDPFGRNYLSTKHFVIQSNQEISIFDKSEKIGGCMMPFELKYGIKHNSVIDQTNFSALISETYIDYEVLNYDQIENGIAVAINTMAMIKKGVLVRSNAAYQAEIRDSNYLNSDLAYVAGTVVNTIIKPEKLKLMKGKFRVRVRTNFPKEFLNQPILVAYLSNIDENILNYAENSAKNGYSAQSSYIPFTFLSFNNLKDRYGFVGCYNVAIDTIEIK
jgi:hypothetical protein